jgi:hypothetical protein
MPDIDYNEPTNINMHGVIPGSHRKMNGAGSFAVCIGRLFGSFVNDHFCDLNISVNVLPG